MAESSLNPESWEGRCTHDESCLHQLSPFLGKMKSTMAAELIKSYSDVGDTVLDPFSGSGTVPLEAKIHNRHTIAIDRNPYSLVLTKAKLNQPKSENKAKTKAEKYLEKIQPEVGRETESIPEWVKEFFHPKTLSGIAQLSRLLRENDEHFLMACLLGILHHQRPGFLSYPASNLKPYLRDEKFPRDEYPERYEYREIENRLIAKIERAYRRYPSFDEDLSIQVEAGNTPSVIANKMKENSVDSVITSPPYMNKLDYGRDNRLRLFFLGVKDTTALDKNPESKESYREFLEDFIDQVSRVLKPNGNLVFVLGEAGRSGSSVDTADVLQNIIQNGETNIKITEIIQDKVPIRKINSLSSNSETILALEKEALV